MVSTHRAQTALAALLHTTRPTKATNMSGPHHGVRAADGSATVASTGDDRTGCTHRWCRSRIVGSIAEPRIATARIATDRFAELTELAASVERDPASVAVAATAIADRSRSEGDHLGVSRALAILGRARRLLGEIDLARSALHAAVAAAQQVGDAEAEADAHLALAGVLALGSTMAAAFAHLDDVERLGSESLQDAARLQRAVLYTRSGRVDEALEMFAAAIPRLRQRDATIDLARVLANRGGIYVRRGELRLAVATSRRPTTCSRMPGKSSSPSRCATTSVGRRPTSVSCRKH